MSALNMLWVRSRWKSLIVRKVQSSFLGYWKHYTHKKILPQEIRVHKLSNDTWMNKELYWWKPHWLHELWSASFGEARMITSSEMRDPSRDVRSRKYSSTAVFFEKCKECRRNRPNFDYRQRFKFHSILGWNAQSENRISKVRERQWKSAQLSRWQIDGLRALSKREISRQSARFLHCSPCLVDGDILAHNSWSFAPVDRWESKKWKSLIDLTQLDMI